jgi:hypothetical protein
MRLAAGERGVDAVDLEVRDVDVSDYTRFGELMRRAPFRPRIFNALGPTDPTHFSSTGR